MLKFSVCNYLYSDVTDNSPLRNRELTLRDNPIFIH